MMNNLPQGILIQRDQEMIYMNQSVKEILGSGEQASFQNSRFRPSEENNSVSEQFVNILQDEVASCLELAKEIRNATTSLYDFIIKEDTFPSAERIKQESFTYKDNHEKDRKIGVSKKNIQFCSHECIECIINDYTISMQLEHEILNKKYGRMFVASLSHELKNPINGIMGILDVLQAERLKEESMQLISAAKSTGQLFLSLIEEAITYYSDEDSIKKEKEWVDLRRIIDECCKLYTFPFQQKNIQLWIDIKQDTPFMVFFDHLRFRQTIITLLGNALKYTVSGHVRIELDYIKPEGLLISSITDTGIGIKPEFISNLFKLFGQLDNACDIHPQGMGFGLSICKRNSIALNGSISVESKLGEGSKFILKIPFEKKDIISAVDTERNTEPRRDDSANIDYSSEPNKDDHRTRQPYESFKKLIPCGKVSEMKEEKASCIEKPCECSQYLITDDDELNRLVIRKLLNITHRSADEVL